MKRRRVAPPAPTPAPETPTWDERAVSAMSQIIEALDKGDNEATNAAIATMDSLIREHRERVKA